MHCGVKQSLTKTLERKNSKQAGRIRSHLRTNLRDPRAAAGSFHFLKVFNRL